MTKTVKKIIAQKNANSIILPIKKEDYNEFITNKIKAKEMINSYIINNKELFPNKINKGYIFDGFTSKSIKVELKLRKIKIDDKIYRIYPSFLIPYCREIDKNLENGLLLSRYGVPFWIIAQIFGKSTMFWFRLVSYFGECSLLGSTVKREIPKNLLSDEKHTYLNGEKAYIATTVAKECILGSELSLTPDEAGLTEAYNVFKTEASNKEKEYKPETINTDGWKPTKKSLSKLFPKVVLILCFLHSYLKVRNVSKKHPKFIEISDKIWNVYKSPSKFVYHIRINELKEYGDKMEDNIIKTKLLEIYDKKDELIKSLEHKNCYKTSNMLDRAMKQMDRKIFSMQNFHKTKESANKIIRGFCLIFNFVPCSPYNIKKHNGKISRVERLNNFSYSSNWLENLNVSTSLGGYSY